MSDTVDTVDAQTSLKDAAARMAEKDEGFLVVQQDDRPIGTLTDRDVVVRGLAKGHTGASPIRDVMAPGITSLPETATAAEAATEMRQRGIRRLTITDEGGAQLKGVVSLADLARHLDSESFTGRILAEQHAAPATA